MLTTDNYIYIIYVTRMYFKTVVVVILKVEYLSMYISNLYKSSIYLKTSQKLYK